jgi:hypothetical protein
MKGERLAECNEGFRSLHSKLDLHPLMPAEMWADAYEYNIDKGIQGMYEDLVHYISMSDMTPILQQRMKHLSTLDYFPWSPNLELASNQSLTTLWKLELGK